jgi:hypothetical protein
MGRAAALWVLALFLLRRAIMGVNGALNPRAIATGDGLRLGGRPAIAAGYAALFARDGLPFLLPRPPNERRRGRADASENEPFCQTRPDSPDGARHRVHNARPTSGLDRSPANQA